MNLSITHPGEDTVARACTRVGLERSDATHFMMVLKSSALMPLSGSDSRLMMSGSRL